MRATPTLKSIKQLIRYGFVGLIINTIGYLTYLFFTYMGAEPKMLITIFYPIAALISFFSQRKWAFAHKGNLQKSGLRYCIAHLLGYLINLLLLFVFADKLHYPHQWVQAIAIFIVAGFLFLTFKFFVFAQQHSADET